MLVVVARSTQQSGSKLRVGQSRHLTRADAQAEMKPRPGWRPAGGAMMQSVGIVSEKGHADSNVPSWPFLPAESKTR
jgi:hypothetical protein